MNFRSIFVFCLLCFALIGAKPADDTYSLIWKPKEGQAISYVLSTDMSAEGQKIEMVLDVNLKVTKLETNGNYTVETTRKNMRVVAEGEEHKVPDEDEKPSVEIFNSKGEKIGGDKDADEADDEMSILLSKVGDFTSPAKPVAKGDKWSETIKADEKKKIKSAKIDFEVLGTDKVGGFDVVKVSIQYKETEGSKPPSFEGTMSFDTKDMSMVQIEASLHDVPLDETTTGEVKVKMLRQS